MINRFFGSIAALLLNILTISMVSMFFGALYETYQAVEAIGQIRTTPSFTLLAAEISPQPIDQNIFSINRNVCFCNLYRGYMIPFFCLFLALIILSVILAFEFFRRIKTERKLGISEGKWLALTFTSPDSYIVTDQDFKISSIHRTHNQFFANAQVGDSLDEVLKNHLGEKYSNLCKLQKLDKVVKFEISVSEDRRRKVIFEILIAPILSRTKVSTGVMLAARDMTHHIIQAQNLESALKEKEHSNASKLAFLANISHDLRTPLTTIMGYIEVLQAQSLGDINFSQKNALQIMSRSSHHLFAMISDLLDLTLIEASQLHINEQLVPIPDLKKQIVKSISSEFRGRVINFDLDMSIESIRIDKKRIIQILKRLVFENFLDNPGISQIHLNGKIALNQLHIGVSKLNKFPSATNSRHWRKPRDRPGLEIAQKLAELLGSQISFRFEGEHLQESILMCPADWRSHIEKELVHESKSENSSRGRQSR